MKCLLPFVWLFLPYCLVAQEIVETSDYDDQVLQLLSKKVFKDKKLGGDCQCSSHLHKNYTLVVKDTIYQNEVEELEFAFSFMNLNNKPFPNKSISDLMYAFALGEIPIVLLGSRVSVVPSSRRINPPKKTAHYYEVVRMNPVHIEQQIFVFFVFEEIRPDRSCTPIFVTLVLDEQAKLLEKKTSTICD